MPRYRSFRKKYGRSATYDAIAGIAAAARARYNGNGGYKRKSARKPVASARRISNKFAKGTRSGTMSKRKSVAGVYGADDKITKSMKILTYPRMKRYAIKNANQNTLHLTGWNWCISEIGQQGYKTIGNFGTALHWLNAYNDSLQTTTNQAALNPLSTTNNDQQLWIDYYNVKWKFTNQGPDLIKMTIYDIMSKKTSQNLPEIHWELGLQDAGGTNVADEVPTQPGVAPMQSAQFRQYNKIVKTTTVYLSSGGHHEHMYHHNVNGIFNLADAWGQPGDLRLPGYSYATMVVITGFPEDNVNTVTGKVPDDPTAVTLAAAKVVATYSFDSRTRILDSKPKNVAYGNALPQAATIANLYGQAPDSSGVFDTVSNVYNALAFS